MRRKILIVDDSEVNRQILHRILSEDYDVLEAENGAVALDILRVTSESISAVLLDILMPVADGYEVLTQMRADANLSSIPVLVTTGNTDIGAEVKALSLGANDFIAKPYNPTIIKHRLWNTVKLRETSIMINSFQRDKLTGLYNRETFFEKASEMVAAHEPGYYVMASFDIDNFKVINDQFGNEIGDSLLTHIADVFRAGFNAVGGICSRVAADNFAALYPVSFMHSEALAELRRKATDMHEFISPISYRVGRYIVDDVTLTASAMYDRAVLAENSIKGRYDTYIAQYDESMRERILRAQEITSEMKGALEKGQFEVWLQPQYNHFSGALIGSEALVRWRHPVRGLIPPYEFIPVFEGNGFIYEMDKYVWEQTCKLLRSWIDEGRSPLPISVNVSRYDVFCEDLIDVVTGLINKYGIPVELLRLEITESAFAKSTEQIISVVKRLIAHGFTIEIDDFGSGYSSLNTLKDVPASVLKLDMRFLENDENSQRGGNILESIVRMAKWLNMSVIAEGVETIEQADYLKSIGCNYVQGYLYARPMPIGEYEALAQTVGKEEKMLALETVETLNSDEFWNPKSIQTLIFNSYVGGACVFEFANGNVELLRANDKCASMLGLGEVSAADALAINWNEHIDEANRALILEAIREAIESGDEAMCELMFNHLSQKSVGVYILATLRMIAHVGERYLFYCLIENRTAQVEAEHKVIQASEQLEAILRNVNGGVSAAVIDNGKLSYVYVNERYYSIFGYTQEQFTSELENGLFDIIYPEDVQIVYDAAERAEATREPTIVEYRARTCDGRIIWARSNGTITHIEGIDLPVHLAVTNDITGEKESESKLIETSEQLGFLNETAHDLLAHTDSEAGIDKVLSKTLDYFGGSRAYIYEYDYENETCTNTYEVCAPDYTRLSDIHGVIPLSAAAYWLNAFESSDFLFIDDYNAIGDERESETNLVDALGAKSSIAVALRANGRVIGTMGVFDPTRHMKDYTNLAALGDYMSVILTRRDLEYKIKNDAQMLTALMNDMPGGFARMRIRPGGISELTYVNDGFCKLVGMTRDEVMAMYGVNSMSLVHADDRERLWKELCSAIDEGREAVCVLRLKHKDGGYRHFRLYCNVVMRESDVLTAYATYTPISSEELSFNEMLPVAMAAMLESTTTELSFVKDLNLNYICCSRAFATMVGLSNEKQIRGKTDYDLFPRELAEKYRSDDKQLIESGKPLVDYVEHLPSDDGMARYSKTSKFLLHDSFGNVIGLYGTGRDITENRAIRERMQLLTDTILGGIAMYELSPNGIKLLYFNDGFSAAAGYTREEYAELCVKDPLILVHADDASLIQSQVEELLGNDEHKMDITYRVRTKHGGYRWQNMKGVLSDRNEGKLLLNVVVFDVTEQKEAEEKLRMSEEQYRLALEHSGNIICRYDVADMSVNMTPEVAAMFAMPEKVLDVPYSPVKLHNIAPESEEDYIDFYESILNGSKAGSVVIRCMTVIGWRWMKASYSTIFSNSGAPTYAVISFEDITEQREMENESEQLKENELVFKAVASHSNRAIYRYDIATRTTYADAVESIDFGIPSVCADIPESMIDSGQILPDSIDDFRRVFSDIHAGNAEGGVKLHVLDREGMHRWLDMRYSLIFSSGDTPKTAVISFVDITENYERELAYLRYQQSIEEDASKERLVFFDTDLTADVVESVGGYVPGMDFPERGCKHEDMVRYGIDNLLSEDSKTAAWAFFSREHLITEFSDGVRTLSEDWCTRVLDNRLRWFRATIQMIQDPYSGHIRAYTSLTDITDEKLAVLDVRKLAETDGMTGLYNKATAEALIRHKISFADGTPCALLIIDLDNLKHINDTMGHPQGDLAIRLLADTLRAQLRRTDIIGRIGGDEFCAFLEGTNDKFRLQSIAMALLARFAGLRIGEEKDTQVFASIGIAVGFAGRTSFDELYDMADKALYQAKRNGKNQFAFYMPE